MPPVPSISPARGGCLQAAAPFPPQGRDAERAEQRGEHQQHGALQDRRGLALRENCRRRPVGMCVTGPMTLQQISFA